MLPMRPALLVSFCLVVGGHAAALHGLMAAPLPKGHDPQTDDRDFRAALRVSLLPAPVDGPLRTTAAASVHRDEPIGGRTSLRPQAAANDDGNTGEYFAAQDVDLPALPRSSPDASRLDDITPSGLPIRLRIYISVDGQVTAVETLLASDDDLLVVQRLREMFLATAFIPAKRNGREVPSYKDIEVDVASVQPPSVVAEMTPQVQP